MPHTALASWFRESYKEAVAAQSAGGEEWHWRAPHPLASRPSRPAASAPQSEEDPVPGIAAPSAAPRIAIVGAGLAGLTCAYRLKQAGFAATIFEADHRRISGRCDSRRGAFEAGQVIERGGMLIDTGHHALRKLIDELGLKTTDLIASELAGTEPFYYFDGQPYTLAEAAADFKQVIPKLKADVQQAGFPATYSEYTPRALELDRMSVVDWIEESIPGGMNSKLGRLIDIACNIEYGAESEEQSALNFIYLHEQVGEDDKFSIFGISDERYQVKGGNDQIVHRLVDRLAPGNIRRGNRLIAIAEQLNGTYQLSFQDRGGRM
ncbi:flavin monoamine oxidase family protein [Paenibacillus albus]|uniref:flavin monoamine oxidase family protein n=1 Tax=Paenibacillus albus TaxID=2495582 RepID=UPI00223CA6AF|nr:FAD-dependent oxidoreductase [Paenibacillus albus]